MNVRTILVPVDFSACSLDVVREAADLARALGARVVVMHATEVPAGLSSAAIAPDGRATTASVYLRGDAEARLAGFVEAARAYGVDAALDVRAGSVVPAILTAVEDHGADWIVMSTHGREGVSRLVLGSVAERVVHRSTVPVTLVRRRPKPACERASCAWCSEHGSAAEDAVAAESAG